MIINVDSNADALTADGSILHPFKTVTAAYNKAKNFIDSTVDCRIVLSSGNYNITDTMLIENSKGELIIEGNSSKNTFLKGSTVIDALKFANVKDNGTLSRVPLSQKNNIYRINLLENGYISDKSTELELVINDSPTIAARYPNDDGVLSASDYLKTGIVSDNGHSFAYPQRALRWTGATDMYVHGMFDVDYFAASYQANVNLVSGNIDLNTNAIVKKDKNYFVYNLLEELDCENEYFYDKTDGNLYICSLSPTTKSYEIQNKNMNIIKLVNSDNVTIRNLTICNNYASLIEMHEGKNNKIENCIMKNGTDNAVNIYGNTSRNNGVLNCEIYDMGKGGIELNGGDFRTLTYGKNYVRNCLIRDFQRLDRTYNPAIGICGVGNIVSNNTIYNAYHTAITMYGNDIIIQNNDISNVCTETTDMGAIYGEGNWTYRGNVIKNNYFHDILLAGPIGPIAIYLDNGLSGTEITSNVFENIGRIGVFINGGRDNTVSNNLFTDYNNNAKYDIGIAISDILNYSGTETNQAVAPVSMTKKLDAIDYKSAIYSKYNHLSNILEDSPVMPKYNIVSKNYVCNISTPLSDDWLKSTNMDKLVSSYNCVCDMLLSSDGDITSFIPDEGFGRQNSKLILH